jgi:hypothetical protein
MAVRGARVFADRQAVVGWARARVRATPHREGELGERQRARERMAGLSDPAVRGSRTCDVGRAGGARSARLPW